MEDLHLKNILKKVIEDFVPSCSIPSKCVKTKNDLFETLFILREASMFTRGFLVLRWIS